MITPDHTLFGGMPKQTVATSQKLICVYCEKKMTWKELTFDRQIRPQFPYRCASCDEKIDAALAPWTRAIDAAFLFGAPNRPGTDQ